VQIIFLLGTITPPSLYDMPKKAGGNYEPQDAGELPET
jgi:hypothetical protein